MTISKAQSNSRHRFGAAAGSGFDRKIPLALLLGAISSTPATAHIIPVNFGTFDGASAVAPISLNSGAVGNYGWADGADADWADTHKLAAFAFTLTGRANVLLQFDKKANAFGINGMVPGFSLYLGSPHSGAVGSDHDYSVGSELLRVADCAATPGCTATEGSFRSLTSWNITNDPDPRAASPSRFEYIGSAYDGSQTLPAANSPLADGNAYLIPGGDGLQDGSVSKLFSNLAPGSYTVFVGGAVYTSQANNANRGVSGSFSLTPAAVPVPGAVWLFGSALAVFGAAKKRKARPL